MEQNFSLSIGKGAWDSQPNDMPEAKGIYFVYRCKKENEKNYLDKLLYNSFTLVRQEMLANA